MLAVMPIADFSLVALDCPDPRALAAFYVQIIGGAIEESPSGEWVHLRTGTGVDLGFQRVPHYESPEWPDGAPQQAHLDFAVPDLDDAERQVLAVGARKTDVQPEPDEWRVLLDPVGHPFCLVLADD